MAKTLTAKSGTNDKLGGKACDSYHKNLICLIKSFWDGEEIKQKLMRERRKLNAMDKLW